MTNYFLFEWQQCINGTCNDNDFKRVFFFLSLYSSIIAVSIQKIHQVASWARNHGTNWLNDYIQILPFQLMAWKIKKIPAIYLKSLKLYIDVTGNIKSFLNGLFGVCWIDKIIIWLQFLSSQTTSIRKSIILTVMDWSYFRISLTVHKIKYHRQKKRSKMKDCFNKPFEFT